MLRRGFVSLTGLGVRLAFSSLLMAAVGPAASIVKVEAADAKPAPYTVVVDAGHGGAPDNAHPNQLFDPGVLGVDGSMEKDLTLDLARRLHSLLSVDRVQVVMTRDSDRYVSISGRTDVANRSQADLFVSIHFNSFTDPTTGGATVLYPGNSSMAFATTMSRAVAARLAGHGIAGDGIQLKDDLWVRNRMQSVTVEGAFLTNPVEAALLQHQDIRQLLAAGIRDGVERQLPGVAQRKRALLAWDVAHPGVNPGALTPAATGLGIALRWIVLGSVVAAVIRGRRALRPLLRARPTLTAMTRRLSAADLMPIGTPTFRRRHRARQRRQALRRRSLERRHAAGERPRSVYDELRF